MSTCPFETWRGEVKKESGLNVRLASIGKWRIVLKAFFIYFHFSICYHDSATNQDRVVGFVANNSRVTNKFGEKLRRQQTIVPVSQAEILRLTPMLTDNPWTVMKLQAVKDVRYLLAPPPFLCETALTLDEATRRKWADFLAPIDTVATTDNGKKKGKKG